MLILTPSFREVLDLLGKNKSFIVTGSLALKLLGSLDRIPGDLDLISNDPSVLKILSDACNLDMTDALEIPRQSKFEFNNGFSVDVFRYKDPSIIPVETVTVEGYTFKVTIPEFVFKRKLENLRGPIQKKTVKDLIDYFDDILLTK